jgi:hypothetical protein
MEREYVGIDFHRRRSVVVRVNAGGERLSVVRVDNDPVALAAAVAEAGPCPEVVWSSPGAPDTSAHDRDCPESDGEPMVPKARTQAGKRVSGCGEHVVERRTGFERPGQHDPDLGFDPGLHERRVRSEIGSIHRLSRWAVSSVIAMRCTSRSEARSGEVDGVTPVSLRAPAALPARWRTRRPAGTRRLGVRRGRR